MVTVQDSTPETAHLHLVKDSQEKLNNEQKMVT